MLQSGLDGGSSASEPIGMLSFQRMFHVEHPAQPTLSFISSWITGSEELALAVFLWKRGEYRVFHVEHHGN